MRLGGWVALLAVGGVASALGVGSTTGDGEVTVTSPQAAVANAAPKVTRVKLEMGGKTWSCPTGTDAKLEPFKQRMGGKKLGLNAVRRSAKAKARQIEAMDKRYPGDAPTQAVADKYNSLVASTRRLNKQESSLVAAYNSAADGHNGIIEADCTS